MIHLFATRCFIARGAFVNFVKHRHGGADNVAPENYAQISKSGVTLLQTSALRLPPSVSASASASQPCKTDYILFYLHFVLLRLCLFSHLPPTMNKMQQRFFKVSDPKQMLGHNEAFLFNLFIHLGR